MPVVVLIADDDLERLERVRRLVEHEGVVAIQALDARDAMRLFVRREPHVIVLHLDGPPELGLALCRDIRSLRTGRARPVVVVGPRESRAAAFEAGCDAFVTPAPDDWSLQRTLRSLLAVARRSSPTGEIELIA